MTAFNILYSDDSLLVVDKPAGLATIAEGWEHDALCLRDLLEAKYSRVWVVHRLDKVTSGVIVFARTAEAHRTLSLLFESRAVTKTYHAILNGIPAWDEHTARHPLRADAGHSHRTVVDTKRGKSAATSFRVRARFVAHSLIEAFPETGRTHQIRAHLAALGFPILADTLYGAPSTDLIARPALHAYSLEFSFSGKPFSFTAPYPPDFENTLQKLRAS